MLDMKSAYLYQISRDCGKGRSLRSPGPRSGALRRRTSWGRWVCRPWWTDSSSWGSLPRDDEDSCRADAVRPHSIPPPVRLPTTPLCWPSGVVRSSYNRSLSQREENSGLLLAASRKPKWCLDLRIIAWPTDKRIRTVPLRRREPLSSSNTTGQLA